jgi:hypothetical protein
MPSYTFSFIAYSDLTQLSGNTLSTTSTTGVTGSFSVSGSPSPVSITVDDDDDIFHDAFIDPGTSQTLATGVTVNGAFYPAGSVVELEFKVSTTTGETFSYIRIGGVNVGIGGAYGDFPQPGTSYTINGSVDGQLEPFEDLACFARGTPIDTVDGPKRVEDLTLDDQILTLSDGPQRPLWIGKRGLSVEDLAARPEWRPIRIKAGAMGNASDLIVSPQHRILISDWRSQLLFAEDDVLVPARALLNDETITTEPADRPVDYFHLLFDRHHVIFSEGVPTESYFPERNFANQTSQAAHAEVMEMFPEVAALWQAQGYGLTSHCVVRTKLARCLTDATAA